MALKGQQAYSIMNVCVFVCEHNLEGDEGVDAPIATTPSLMANDAIASLMSVYVC